MKVSTSLALKTSVFPILLLIMCAILPLASQAQTSTGNNYLTIVVEFENAVQRIFVTEQHQKARKIAVLSPLKDANNIAKNIRLREQTEYKEKGFTIKNKKLNSLYDFSVVFELLNEYEAAGWTLIAHNLAAGGAQIRNEYEGKAMAFYSMTRPKQ